MLLLAVSFLNLTTGNPCYTNTDLLFCSAGRLKRFTFRKAPSPKTTLITIFTTVFPTKHMMSIVRIPMSFYVLEHPLSRLNGVFAPPPDQSVFLLFQKGGGALHSAAFSDALLRNRTGACRSLSTGAGTRSTCWWPWPG